jgi:hypothetical protein
VNGDHYDSRMESVLFSNYLHVETDQVYRAGEMDIMFRDVGRCLICLCCVVIRREVWEERNRQPFYGTWFIWVGVILQNPMPAETFVLARPIMRLRLDNQQTWSHVRFFAMRIEWPRLVWESCLSESTKLAFSARAPWSKSKYLLAFRMTGTYTPADYDLWVRPRLESFPMRLVAKAIAHLSQRTARHICRIYSFIFRTSPSPMDLYLAMFPKGTKEFLERGRSASASLRSQRRLINTAGRPFSSSNGRR